MVYSIKDVPTAGIRSEVGIYFEASIRNIIQFYKTLLLDKKMVSFESFGATILPAVQTIIEETLTGADPVTISANAQLIYKQKMENDTSAKYVMSALDFKALEGMCDKFTKHIGETDCL